MKIVLAGGSGFIGEPLARRMSARGDVVVLTRDPSKIRIGRAVAWNPPGSGEWTRELAEADVIINLAGESIGAGRWSDARKQRLIASRLDATGALVDAIRARDAKSQPLFISMSAIGYYGPRGDESLDESASAGSDFLAGLAKRWEAAAHAGDAAARVVILRLGIVLAADGGALAKMLLPFRLGLGGPIGSGRQWMSWIDRDDVIGLIDWVIDRDGRGDDVRGSYNATAPAAVTNREFVSALGRALHRPALIPVPAFALRLLFGEMADLLLTGQWVVPARASGEGFVFERTTLDNSLTHALAKPGSILNN